MDGMGRSVGLGVVTAESNVLWLKTSMLDGSVSIDFGKGCDVWTEWVGVSDWVL